MIARALVRYVAGDAARAERWVAPVVLFMIVTVSGTAAGGAVLDGYGLTLTALFPISVWVAVTVLNSEDPVQTLITTVTVGSSFRVRAAKLLVALAACQVMTLFAVVWPLLTGHPAGPGEVCAGLLGHLLSSLAGVAVGSSLGRPVVRRPAGVVLIGLAAFLVEVLVPGFAPVRPLAVAFSGSDATGVPWDVLAVVTLQTLAGAVAVILLAQRLARGRG